MVSEEHQLYTGLSLFAEIGGYVGLLLGVSLWNFAGLKYRTPKHIWMKSILQF